MDIVSGSSIRAITGKSHTNEHGLAEIYCVRNRYVRKMVESATFQLKGANAYGPRQCTDVAQKVTGEADILLPPSLSPAHVLALVRRKSCSCRCRYYNTMFCSDADISFVFVKGLFKWRPYKVRHALKMMHMSVRTPRPQRNSATVEVGRMTSYTNQL